MMIRRPKKLALLLPFTAALSIAASWACTRERAPSSSGSGGTDTGRSALVSGLGQCALSQYGNLKDALRTLQTQTATYAAAPAEANTAELAQARAAWIGAMAEWQKTEAFAFGPLATPSPDSDPGGQDLRSDFYAWPLDARCAVEEALAKKAYETPNFATTASIAARGLSALEYLLFFEGDQNGCSGDNEINKNALWPAPPELKARRAAYAKVVATDLAARGDALVALWEPTKGNFLGTFTTAGRGSKIYDGDNRAVSAAAGAASLLTLAVKDAKLGEPAGVVKCTKPICPEMLESKFAKISRDEIVNSLVGLKRMLFGCAADGSGVGFDDVLIGLGDDEFAKRLRADVDSAIAKVSALPDASLEQSLQTSLEQVKAARTAVKLVDTDIKVELKSVLDLKLPQLVANDND